MIVVAWEALEALGCEPRHHVPLEASAREDDVRLVVDLYGETLGVRRVGVEQGLPEVLGKRLGGGEQERGEGEGAHVDATVYVSDVELVACARVANVGVDGEGST